MNPGALLKDKTVLISGASSGIGAHLAQTCARCGANVVLAAKAQGPCAGNKIQAR